MGSYITGSSTWCSVSKLEGGMREGGSRGKGTYVYLCLTHVDIWQNHKHYKVIILIKIKKIL